MIHDTMYRYLPDWFIPWSSRKPHGLQFQCGETWVHKGFLISLQQGPLGQSTVGRKHWFIYKTIGCCKRERVSVSTLQYHSTGQKELSHLILQELVHTAAIEQVIDQHLSCLLSHFLCGFTCEIGLQLLIVN